MAVFSNPLMVAFYVLSMLVVGSHLWHGVSSAVQSLGGDHPRWTPRVRAVGKVAAVAISGAFIVIALWAYFVGERGHEAGCSGAVRPDRGEMGPAQVRDEAGQPGQQTEVHHHRRRHRAGRRIGRGLARRAGLQRPELLHSGQPAAGAQHRGAGRHQCREELPERRRQHLPAVLRHGQGRRLPLARIERLPPRPAEREHHRPVRGAGRPVRARVRRAARQPVVWRRAGLAHVLRARSDRAAAAHRRLPVAHAPGAREARPPVRAPRDARRRRHRRQGPRHHRAQSDHRRDRALRGRRRHPGDRRVRHGLLPVDQRGELQRHRRVACAQARRAVRQPLLHADSSRPASPSPAITSRSSR